MAFLEFSLELSFMETLLCVAPRGLEWSLQLPLAAFPLTPELSLQEKISEDLRATLNAFLHRTGQHSSK